MGSNFGSEQVDLFAPFTLWLGPDPAAPGNAVREKSGTSFSAPFAAGVAALVWAADPSLHAGEVERILLETAKPSPHPEVGRVIHALGAVKAVLGNIPPSVEVLQPKPGAQIHLHTSVFFNAAVGDFEDGVGCCAVTWSSSVDGQLGTGKSISTTFDLNEPGAELSCDAMVWTSSSAEDADFPIIGCDVDAAFGTLGGRTVAVTGTDSQGASANDSVAITVVAAPADLPPSVRITSPENLQSVQTNEEIVLSGEATDPEGATPLTLRGAIAATTSCCFGSSSSIEGGAIFLRGRAPWRDLRHGAAPARGCSLYA